MKIEQFKWSTVKIRYEAPVDQYCEGRITGKEVEDLENVSIFFRTEPGGYRSLQLDHRGGSILLARPEVIELTPRNARFEAYWWSSKMESFDYEHLVKATIDCEF